MILVLIVLTSTRKEVEEISLTQNSVSRIQIMRIPKFLFLEQLLNVLLKE